MNSNDWFCLTPLKQFLGDGRVKEASECGGRVEFLTISKENAIKQFFLPVETSVSGKNRAENFYILKTENLFISQMFWRASENNFCICTRKLFQQDQVSSALCKQEKSALKESISSPKKGKISWCFMILVLRLSEFSRKIFSRFLFPSRSFWWMEELEDYFEREMFWVFEFISI